VPGSGEITTEATTGGIRVITTVTGPVTVAPSSVAVIVALVITVLVKVVVKRPSPRSVTAERSPAFVVNATAPPAA